jgi:hypothetical protein
LDLEGTILALKSSNWKLLTSPMAISIYYSSV